MTNDKLCNKLVTAAAVSMYNYACGLADDIAAEGCKCGDASRMSDGRGNVRNALR